MFKIIRFNCCGLDVHKTWIYACIGITDANFRTEYFEARFSSFPKDLRRLAAWLQEHQCVEVCMESSGKYWIPVFNVLEETCKVTLAHPKYTKPQKGNKTDRNVINQGNKRFFFAICALHNTSSVRAKAKSVYDNYNPASVVCSTDAGNWFGLIEP